eukprot:10171534-Karenia_brevis.AAC.1
MTWEDIEDVVRYLSPRLVANTESDESTGTAQIILEVDEEAKGIAKVVELIADRQHRREIPYVLPSDNESISDKRIAEE